MKKLLGIVVLGLLLSVNAFAETWSCDNDRFGKSMYEVKDSEIVLKAAQKKIPIVGEIEFASWFSNDPIIAVTGSNGKTTTSNMLYKMCQSKEMIGTMAGNMGIPFSERVLNNIKDPKENILYLMFCDLIILAPCQSISKRTFSPFLSFSNTGSFKVP